MAHAVKDTVAKLRTSQKSTTDAQKAAEEADKALADAKLATDAADSALKHDMSTLRKPYLYTEEDGSQTVFVPDMTDDGYTELHLAPTDATVEDDPNAPPADQTGGGGTPPDDQTGGGGTAPADQTGGGGAPPAPAESAGGNPAVAGTGAVVTAFPGGGH